MNKVHITYYGHSCFKISTENGSVILDPYENDSVPGLSLPKKLQADAVYCSHEHADHNAAHLIALSGNPAPFPVSFLTVPHDNAEGAKRGMSKITFLKVDGVTVAHLGDIGRLPTEEEYRELSQADIIMLPCAGYYTISSVQAWQIIQNLKKPSLKILMHFRDGRRGYDVQEEIRGIMRNIPDVKRLPESEIEIDPDNIPDQIITMQVYQSYLFSMVQK